VSVPLCDITSDTCCVGNEHSSSTERIRC